MDSECDAGWRRSGAAGAQDARVRVLALDPHPGPGCVGRLLARSARLPACRRHDARTPSAGQPTTGAARHVACRPASRGRPQAGGGRHQGAAGAPPLVQPAGPLPEPHLPSRVRRDLPRDACGVLHRDLHRLQRVPLQGHDATGQMLLSFFLYSTPQYTYYITAMAALVGTLVTVGLLTRTSELTVMQACGVSLYRATVPMLLFGLTWSVVLFGMEQSILAASNRRAEELKSTIRSGMPRTFGNRPAAVDGRQQGRAVPLRPVRPSRRSDSKISRCTRSGRGAGTSRGAPTRGSPRTWMPRRGGPTSAGDGLRRPQRGQRFRGLPHHDRGHGNGRTTSASRNPRRCWRSV